MYYAKICVILLAVMPAIYTDYCDANLCDEGKKHIGCGNDGNIDPNCLLPLIVSMTPDYRKQIVGKHNLLRNKIAKGFAKFPPASRMATMVWDDELAMLAELNVKQCEMLPDKCRTTSKFPFVGQNLALRSWIGLNFTVSEVIDTQIQAWFSEYIHCSLDVISSYRPSYRPTYRRFTTMVQDKSTHIGCAILRSLSGGFRQQIMACNYAYDNILGDPLYISGCAASLCITGTNDKFTSWCSVQEKYDLDEN